MQGTRRRLPLSARCVFQNGIQFRYRIFVVLDVVDSLETISSSQKRELVDFLENRRKKGRRAGTTLCVETPGERRKDETVYCLWWQIWYGKFQQHSKWLRSTRNETYWSCSRGSSFAQSSHLWLTAVELEASRSVCESYDHSFFIYISQRCRDLGTISGTCCLITLLFGIIWNLSLKIWGNFIKIADSAKFATTIVKLLKIQTLRYAWTHLQNFRRVEEMAEFCDWRRADGCISFDLVKRF